MGLFKRKGKAQEVTEGTKVTDLNFAISSPLTGELIPLSEVPDQVFSEKILGDGFAIIPTDGVVVSPIKGNVVQVFDTKHAITISNDEGVEVLIHFGIDTVTLQGKAFTAFVKSGDKVDAGTKLFKGDIEAIKSEGLSIVTPVIFTAPERSFNVEKANVLAGEVLKV
jgi:glucose PTS system EIICBA or EIICB component